uniref:(northern house mosquito) hypothetical protein n=1 Tax=Culex pipiens TaxID=7175 RepID=A0A8D8F4A5_CULPI
MKIVSLTVHINQSFCTQILVTDIFVSSKLRVLSKYLFINPLKYCRQSNLQQSLINFTIPLLQDWVRKFNNFGIRRQQLPSLLCTLKGTYEHNCAFILESGPYSVSIYLVEVY